MSEFRPRQDGGRSDRFDRGGRDPERQPERNDLSNRSAGGSAPGPNAKRDLHYKTTEDVLLDVERLKRGNRKLGNWTLAQACWHLNEIMKYLMAPGPHAETTREQLQAQARLEIMLTTGQMPRKRIEAPPAVVPPPTAGERDVNDFMKTLVVFMGHKNYATHRIFGKLSDEDMRKLNLVHCAHHFSHFIPA